MSSQVIERIENCPKVKKFKRMLENGDFSVNVSEFLDELDRMHKTRTVRLITKKDVLHNAQNKLIDASIQNQAYRSRCVEIKMLCYRVESNITQHKEVLINYLKTTYKKALSIYKTNAERDSVIETILSDSSWVIQQLQMIQELSDMIIDDIDKASWSLKTLIEVLKLASKPEDF